MAAGKSFEFRTFDTLLKPVSSIFPVRAEADFSSGTNNSDLSSDSGNETEENARNVARWLESLPNEENWCKTVEDEVIRENGEQTTGDAEYNSTIHEIPLKKRATVNKYRRGTPRVSSDSRCKKKKASSLKVVEEKNGPIVRDRETVDYPKEEGPNFLNEELARALDDSMTRAIRRYKRHETNWSSNFPRAISSSEPPTKRSKS